MNLNLHHVTFDFLPISCHKTGQQANNGVAFTARMLLDDYTRTASGQQATVARQAAQR
jgi:hypothetical protein